MQEKVRSMDSLAEPSALFAISSLPWFEVLGGVASMLVIPNVFRKVVGLNCLLSLLEIRHQSLLLSKLKV